MSSNIFNQGPIAPQRNPDPMPEWFRPSRFGIDAIAQGTRTTVTTAEDHNYVLGQLIRMLVPFNYGMRQINELDGYVTSIPSDTQVEVDINSLTFDAFIAAPSYIGTPPSIQAIGDVNTGLLVTSRSGPTPKILGSFLNISPSAGG